MTEAYARALLAVRAAQLREAAAEVAKTEKCPILAHRLAEVSSECEWCERTYGEEGDAK